MKKLVYLIVVCSLFISCKKPTTVQIINERIGKDLTKDYFLGKITQVIGTDTVTFDRYIKTESEKIEVFLKKENTYDIIIPISSSLRYKSDIIEIDYYEGIEVHYGYYDKVEYYYDDEIVYIIECSDTNNCIVISNNTYEIEKNKLNVISIK